MVVSLIGGIGLFLLGMILLTDGLKSFAGDALRQALLRFTGKPVSAFTSGALVTALVQSSSATTLTTIGFVSAGLLSFNQAVGLVMGASLGTTSTGWLVSVFGLKFSISNIALPLIGVGAFVRLLGRGRISSLGLALAGFGLIFVGIDQLQAGMAGLTEHIDLEAIPSSGFFGHLLMMAIGIALTVIMQSSSAAVATTLAALHAEAISFEQAASLVIGAAVGTTVTAAIAAIGASTPAKRTALAHILFNLFTGLVAVVLLPIFIGGLNFAQERFGLDRGAVSLAAFHTAFIAVGVLIFLPIVNPFSRMIERILPERGPHLTRHLDPSLLQVPPVALEAVRGALRDSAVLLFKTLDQRMQSVPPNRETEMATKQLEQALADISTFVSQIPAAEHESRGNELAPLALHAIDHLTQLSASINQRHLPPDDKAIVEARDLCRALLGKAMHYLSDADNVAPDANADPLEQPDTAEEVQTLSSSLAEWRRKKRIQFLERSASGTIAPPRILLYLDTIRWIDQIGYHTARITHYLKR